jgi:hypothetical protein
MKFLKDESGSVDVEAWLSAIVGFSVVYILWVMFTPVFIQLHDLAITLVTGQWVNAINFVMVVWNYGVIIDAAYWIVYIWATTIREEVAEKYNRSGGYV